MTAMYRVSFSKYKQRSTDTFAEGGNDTDTPEALRGWPLFKTTLRSAQIAAGFKNEAKKLEVAGLAFRTTYKDRTNMPNHTRMGAILPENNPRLDPTFYERAHLTSMSHQMDTQVRSTKGMYFGPTKARRPGMYNHHQFGNPAPCDYAKVLERRWAKRPQLQKSFGRAKRFMQNRSFAPGPGTYQPENSRACSLRGIKKGPMAAPVIRFAKSDMVMMMGCSKCKTVPKGDYWVSDYRLPNMDLEEYMASVALKDAHWPNKTVLCLSCYRKVEESSDFHDLKILARFKRFRSGDQMDLSYGGDEKILNPGAFTVQTVKMDPDYRSPRVLMRGRYPVIGFRKLTKFTC